MRSLQDWLKYVESQAQKKDDPKGADKKAAPEAQKPEGAQRPAASAPPAAARPSSPAPTASRPNPSASAAQPAARSVPPRAEPASQPTARERTEAPSAAHYTGGSIPRPGHATSPGAPLPRTSARPSEAGARPGVVITQPPPAAVPTPEDSLPPGVERLGRSEALPRPSTIPAREVPPRVAPSMDRAQTPGPPLNRGMPGAAPAPQETREEPEVRQEITQQALVPTPAAGPQAEPSAPRDGAAAPTAAPGRAKPVLRPKSQETPEPEAAADPAELWSRLPKHLQLLVSSERREIAERYYKGFKEDRAQLLQRLLDPELSLEETARVLGVCPTTVRRYTNRKLLNHHRTAGNQRRFRLSDVLEFLEKYGS